MVDHGLAHRRATARSHARVASQITIGGSPLDAQNVLHHARAVRATIREVARAAGVSTATVSHALSGNRPVNPRTRQRVKRVADSLGYRPNAIAAAMPTGRTQTLGMVVPDLS